MVVVVDSVAYGVEAVVVADVEAVAKVYYIGDSFTGDAVDCASGEAECDVVGDCLGHFYV